MASEFKYFTECTFCAALYIMKFVNQVNSKTIRERALNLLKLDECTASEETETKVCKKCKEEKPKSEFYKRSDSRDGLQHRCKSCVIAAAKKTQSVNRLKNARGIDATGVKVCVKCKTEKSKSEFYKDVTRHDGLQAWCKTCGKKISADNIARLDSKSRPLAQKHSKRWSNEDDQFVIMNYGTMPANQMAIELGRTYNSVNLRVHKLRQAGKLA